jgi:hypothetical protein
VSRGHNQYHHPKLVWCKSVCLYVCMHKGVTQNATFRRIWVSTKNQKMNSISPNNSQAPQSEATILQVGATLISALTNRGHAKIKYSNHQYNEPKNY